MIAVKIHSKELKLNAVFFLSIHCFSTFLLRKYVAACFSFILKFITCRSMFNFNFVNSLTIVATNDLVSFPLHLESCE